MKKQFLLLFLMFLPIIASADAVEINGIYYNFFNNSKLAEVAINPNKYSGDVNIPETVKYDGTEYMVTIIGENAFAGCDQVTSVIIPTSVKTISGGAFAGCNGITSIIIPESVTTIDDQAFLDCNGITSIIIPESVTTIGHLAFKDCKNLVSATIGDGVTTIGEQAFYRCSKISTITIGKSVKEIKSGAFRELFSLKKVIIRDLANWCGVNIKTDANPLKYAHNIYSDEDTQITNLVIPNSVKKINKEVFSDCSGISYVTIPSSVEIIGESAFSNCSGITSINIPNSVTSIGRSAFMGCNNLAKVTISNNLTTICSKAFGECKSLTSISFPDNVKIIEAYAFQNCSSLSSITIGDGIEAINAYAFKNCRNLENVYCYSEKVPETHNDAFFESFIEYVTLHVPETAINQYKLSDPWKNFKSIVAINGGGSESPKCEKPTISYENGEISFKCSTEGVEYISEIKCDDIKQYYDSKIQLKATYSISVYATKSGYQNSDFVNATLCWIDKEPKTEGISNSVANVNARAVLIQSNGGNITIQGCDDGEQVSVYSINGEQLGYAISKNGQASVDTSIKQGSVAIVKMGNKSVKISIR